MIADRGLGPPWRLRRAFAGLGTRLLDLGLDCGCGCAPRCPAITRRAEVGAHDVPPRDDERDDYKAHHVRELRLTELADELPGPAQWKSDRDEPRRVPQELEHEQRPQVERIPDADDRERGDRAEQTPRDTAEVLYRLRTVEQEGRDHEPHTDDD